MAVKLAIAKEVRHLTQRMNTGVGATRADDARGTSQESRDRLFQNRLNRAPIRLGLPAAVIRAVVFNRELDIHDRLVSGFGMRRRGVTETFKSQHEVIHGPYIRRQNKNGPGKDSSQ